MSGIRKGEIYLTLRDKILQNMKKVDLGYRTECWLWTGICHGDIKRGVVYWAGKKQFAYRAAYEEWFGIIPRGAWACHKCNQPMCVNPFHIYLGTPTDNANDRERHYKEKAMKDLYNCKTLATELYRMTKFDKHLIPKVGSSYIVSNHGCDCPQGNQTSCRHRKMLPFFVEHGYVDTEYFFVWDTHLWYKGPAALAQVRAENGKPTPAEPLKLYDEDLLDHMRAAGLDPVVIDERTTWPITDTDPLMPEPEGGQKPVSAAPSPQPSRIYRRF